MNDKHLPSHHPADHATSDLEATITQAWQEQLAQAAKQPPLAATLLRQSRALYDRFVAVYRELLALSRQRRRKLLRNLGTSLAGAALAMALSSTPVAYAAGISVDGSCTLVDAITAANTDTAVGGCAAGSGADTIFLPANGTYSLTAVNNTSDGPNGLPVITSAITIAGNGATITRDGSAPLFRLFKVAYSGNLTLNDTTITGGNPGSNLNDEGLPRPFIGSGGGILNRGTTALNNSSVSGNIAIYGGGITSVQWLTLSNSSVSGNTSNGKGGGIYATNPGPYYGNPESTLTLNNSTVSGNADSNPYGSGGGISNGATTAILNNSTVSGNVAASAGGIRNYTTLTLNNSTVSGNSASNSYSSGGGILTSNTLTLSNSTVTGNTASTQGGGIMNFSTITLERSLISGNTANSAQEIYSTPLYCYAPDYCFGGIVNAANFNLLGHNGQSSAQAFTNFTPSGSDITATSDGTLPTALTSILNTTLANNGGPSTSSGQATLTHALVTGSPAIDAAPTGPVTDQRGVARPQGPAFDSGAFELEQAANTAPVATNDSYSTNEDTALTIAAPGVLGNDTDADSNPITAQPVTGPAHGTLLLNADGSFTYTPDANYSGADSFTYVVNDGTVDSTAATVSLTVNPVNDAPAAMADSYSTNEDTALTIAAPGVLGNDSDGEGNPLSAVLVSGPTNGSLTLNADGSFSYTPNANFNGSDSFSYKANDGAADSNVVTVALTVNPVNDAPVAANDSYATNEDAALTIAASGVLGNDIDGEGNPLTAALVDAPANGVVTVNPDGSFTYTPNANFNGSDSFTYQVNDGLADSNVATVAITVNPVNDAPVAADDGYLTDEDAPLTVSAALGVQANDTDIDTAAPTALLVAGPAHGTLTLNADGSFSYTPATDFNGSDSFTYKLNDGAADSNVATVSITIGGLNDAPVAVNDTYATNEDTPLTVAAPGVRTNDSDVDNDPLTLALVDAPIHGTLTLNADGSFSYTPAADFNGSDSFSYQLNDGQVNSAVATVSLTVNAVNDAPLATDDSYDTNEDVVLTVAAPGVLGNDTDNDGNALSAVVVSGPAHGSLTLNANGSFNYTPAANFSGTDSFSYKVNDGATDSNVTTVALTIAAVNDAPVAGNDSDSTNQNTTLNVVAPGVLGNDSDPVEGSPLTAVLVIGPAHGTLTLNANGSFNYTPAANFSGTDSFTYKANDGGANSNIATVTLTVASASDLIDTMVTKVQALVNSGVLNSGNGNALIVKLQNAQKKLMGGQTAQAINMMQAFINEVDAFLNGGVFTPAQEQALVDDANAVIAALN